VALNDGAEELLDQLLFDGLLDDLLHDRLLGRLLVEEGQWRGEKVHWAHGRAHVAHWHVVAEWAVALAHGFAPVAHHHWVEWGVAQSLLDELLHDVLLWAWRVDRRQDRRWLREDGRADELLQDAAFNLFADNTWNDLADDALDQSKGLWLSFAEDLGGDKAGLWARNDLLNGDWVDQRQLGDDLNQELAVDLLNLLGRQPVEWGGRKGVLVASQFTEDRVAWSGNGRAESLAEDPVEAWGHFGRWEERRRRFHVVPRWPVWGPVVWGPRWSPARWCPWRIRQLVMLDVMEVAAKHWRGQHDVEQRQRRHLLKKSKAKVE